MVYQDIALKNITYLIYSTKNSLLVETLMSSILLWGSRLNTPGEVKKLLTYINKLKCEFHSSSVLTY